MLLPVKDVSKSKLRLKKGNCRCGQPPEAQAEAFPAGAASPAQGQRSARAVPAPRHLPAAGLRDSRSGRGPESEKADSLPHSRNSERLRSAAAGQQSRRGKAGGARTGAVFAAQPRRRIPAAQDAAEEPLAEIAAAWLTRTPSQQLLRGGRKGRYDSAAAVAALEQQFSPMRISPPGAKQPPASERQAACAASAGLEPAGREQDCAALRQKQRQRNMAGDEQQTVLPCCAAVGSDEELPQARDGLCGEAVAPPVTPAEQRQHVVTTPGGHVAAVGPTPVSALPAPPRQPLAEIADACFVGRRAAVGALAPSQAPS